MKTDDNEKAGDVLLADTSPANEVSVFACDICSLFAPCSLLTQSNAVQSRNTQNSKNFDKSGKTASKDVLKSGGIYLLEKSG